MHYPTDTTLLWDALRKVINVTARACKEYEIEGWRQSRYHERQVKRLLRKTQKQRRSRSKDVKKQEKKRQKIHQSHREYLDKALEIVVKAETTLGALSSAGAVLESELISHYIEHARRQIDQVERRVLNGETIPHDEKVFSIFESHTRWLMKGKAGVPVELGVAVCVVEDQHQFVLYHRILWDEGDDQVAVAMVTETQARFADFAQCRFDRAFHSPANRQAFDELLIHNVLPKKGYLSQADQERESSEVFVKAR